MNSDNTFATITAIFSSDPSYKTLVEMINEMDLEVLDVKMA